MKLHSSALKVLRFAIVLSCTLACGPLFAEDWPQERYDVQGSGATPTELPKDLELLWEKRLEGTGFDRGPIIADGMIYCGDADGVLWALSLKDGEVAWKHEEETMYNSSPSYQDGVLYAGDIDGQLRAFDAKTGDVKWKFDAEMEIDAGPNFFEDSLLLTSQNGTLYSLSKKGELNWKYSIEQPLQCGATLAGNRTFLGGCDEQFHTIDVKKGTLLGEPSPLGAPTGSTPTVSDNRVFVPTYAGAIFAFEPGKKEPVWTFREPKLADKFENSSVAVAKGLVVACSRTPKRVFALEAATGKVKWEMVPRKRSDASPIIAGNSVFVAAADGRVIRLDLMTGEQTWMSEVKPSFLASPAAADGRLVVANDRGTVYCFGAKKR